MWRPRSLHTAEATGSKPVTPTSTNALPTPTFALAVSKSVSKSQSVASRHTDERLEHRAAGVVQLEDRLRDLDHHHEPFLDRGDHTDGSSRMPASLLGRPLKPLPNWPPAW